MNAAADDTRVPKLLSLFTLYYLSERLLRYLVSKHLHSSNFQQALHSSRKDSVYFGIFLGAFISLISFPFCTNALWRYSPFSSHHSVNNNSLPTSAEICVDARVVLWISELNRLDIYPLYVYHHVGCIVMILSVFHLHALEILYLPLATLVTEVTGDLVWVLAAHQEMDSRLRNNTKLENARRMLQQANIWMYALGRIPSIPITLYSVVLFTGKYREDWNDVESQALFAWAFFVLLIYFAWVTAYLRRQMHGLRREKRKKDSVFPNVKISIQNGQVGAEDALKASLSGSRLDLVCGQLSEPIGALSMHSLDTTNR
jgi:hypothetical protein